MKLFQKFAFVAFVLYTLSASLAYAETGVDEGEAYGVPSFRDMVQTAVMMDAFDISNPLIDEYARLFYCDLYQKKFSNDFEWNNIRQEISGRLKGKKEFYRILYQFAVPVYLGRYNFDTQDFPFEKKTALISIGAMELMSVAANENRASKCLDLSKPGIFYKRYVVKLTETLTLDRLKIPVATSEKFLAKMQSMNNTERLVYLRFRVKLAAANKGKSSKAEDSAPGYFLGKIISIDVFLDKEFTQFVVNVPLNKE